ncbi:MAG: hypothetical protein O3A46_01195 [Candidatus Poribacteria bacterium]|nr:hypothetical protein [Candidatus Poribacteria bacterium]
MEDFTDIIKFMFVMGGIGIMVAMIVIGAGIAERISGRKSKPDGEDTESLQNQMSALREELRDMHEMLADLTLTVNDTERKALPRDE